MTGGNAPLGRRDNGLHTTDYAVVADVDPRIGEHLLVVLGDRGIAAYLKPTADVDPLTRSASLPSFPTDRLYVDRAGVPTARHLLAEAMASEPPMADIAPAAEPQTSASGGSDGDDLAGGDPIAVSDGDGRGGGASPAGGHGVDAGGEPSADDFETAWAQIVAGYGVTATPERNWPGDGTSAGPPAPDPTADPKHAPASDPKHPTASDPKHAPPSDPEPAAGDPAEPRRVVKPNRPYLNDDRGSLLDGLDLFGAGLPDDDDEEDFKPPPPPPLPRITPIAIGGVVAIVLGMLAIFFPDAVAVLAPTETQVLGGTLVLGGTALLISRLRPGTGDDEDRDPDDGAVV